MAAHRRGQPGAIGAGGLDRERQQVSEAKSPVDQLLVSGTVGSERALPRIAPESSSAKKCTAR
jgi:hypothetical protein